MRSWEYESCWEAAVHIIIIINIIIIIIIIKQTFYTQLNKNIICLKGMSSKFK